MEESWIVLIQHSLLCLCSKLYLNSLGIFKRGEIIARIIAFLFVFSIIVIIHEFGHYYFAKKAGILVREFAIGMGPKIFQVRKGETVYTLRLLPIGGYVTYGRS